jgi:Ca-activated chloride channel family protein
VEFAYPQFLWLLLSVPPLLLCWALGASHHRRMRERFGNLENLKQISRVSWSGRNWLRGLLFAGSLVGMVLGLAAPRMTGRDLRPVPMPTDVIFMLDVSPSMFARDMDPTRLGRAQQIIRQFVLQKRPDDRYALVPFNVSGVVLSYLTRDPENILLYFDYLNQTTEPAIGTNMGAALVGGLRVIEADDQLNRQNAGSRRRVLILISDGDDTLGEWREPLAEIVRKQLKLYTIGLGTATGASFPLAIAQNGDVLRYATSRSGERIISKAQARTLRDFAQRTAARFYRGEDNRQVQAAIDEVLTAGRPVAGYRAEPVRHELYFHVLAAAFLFLIAGTLL